MLANTIRNELKLHHSVPEHTKRLTGLLFESRPHDLLGSFNFDAIDNVLVLLGAIIGSMCGFSHSTGVTEDSIEINETVNFIVKRHFNVY